jgi:hypothetical protein
VSSSEASRVEMLVAPAAEALAGMVTPSGLMCFEVRAGELRGWHGESVRYTLIATLGLLRAVRSGGCWPLAPERLRDAADAELERPEVTPGDLALRLWIEARADTGSAPALIERLERSLSARGGLAGREGLELAWIVTALAELPDAGSRGRSLLAAALDQLIDGNQAASGLFRHFGEPGARRGFPNFATQIYSVLALALVAGRGLDARALPAATRAADRLLELQLPDGGWPWLFDSERGNVVERYEVYAVHQHGMAPMALHELARAAGDDRYVAAAERGLPWLFGANDLSADMAHLGRGLTHRSIRRARPLDRLWLYANTALATAVGRPRGGRGRRLEVNRTCRPYELGWLVEAWAGAHDSSQAS